MTDLQRVVTDLWLKSLDNWLILTMKQKTRALTGMEEEELKFWDQVMNHDKPGAIPLGDISIPLSCKDEVNKILKAN